MNNRQLNKIVKRHCGNNFCNGVFHYKVQFFFLLLIAIFFSCNQEGAKEKVDRITSEEVLPLEIGKDIEFIYSDSGIVKAILSAPLMESFSQLDEPYTEMREGFFVTFFDRMQKPNSFLSANYGIQRPVQNRIEARDSVVVVNTQGDTLKSEELIWDEIKNKIFSNKQVIIKTADETLIGDGIISNPEFTEYEFIKPRGKITIKEEEK